MSLPLTSLRRKWLVYPRVQRVDEDLRLAERMATTTGRLPIWCPVCGRLGLATGFPDQIALARDAGTCRSCGSVNRQRLLGHAVARVIAEEAGRIPHSLRGLPVDDTRIYNTEAAGPVHRELSRFPRYVASEYLGDAARPGEEHDGVRHEDLMGLSFPDRSFDLVLSSDVLEHVAEPYVAHREIHRVLDEGGRHVFTVPFHFLGYRDEVRTELADDGTLTHLAPPVYHDDPLRSGEGALVHTIFGLEMLSKLRDIGFVTFCYSVYAPHLGIVGENAFLFEAIKIPWGWA